MVAALLLAAIMHLQERMRRSPAFVRHQTGTYYKQNGFTKDGCMFRLFKFRSMKVDIKKYGVPRLNRRDVDSRITKIVEVVKEHRPHKVSQLRNNLKAEMSMVGPRPERPKIASEKQLPEFKLRLLVRRGATG